MMIISNSSSCDFYVICNGKKFLLKKDNSQDFNSNTVKIKHKKSSKIKINWSGMFLKRFNSSYDDAKCEFNCLYEFKSSENKINIIDNIYCQSRYWMFNSFKAEKDDNITNEKYEIVGYKKVSIIYILLQVLLFSGIPLIILGILNLILVEFNWVVLLLLLLIFFLGTIPSLNLLKKFCKAKYNKNVNTLLKKNREHKNGDSTILLIDELINGNTSFFEKKGLQLIKNFLNDKK